VCLCFLFQMNTWACFHKRVAPSDKILDKMWAFTYKIKEKILVKKKVIQKVSSPLKELLRSQLLGVQMRTFKRLNSFFSRGENGRKMKREKKCVADNYSELINCYRLTPGPKVSLMMAMCSSTNWTNSKHCSSVQSGFLVLLGFESMFDRSSSL